MNEWMLRDLLAFHNVEILTNTQAKEITSYGLKITVGENEQTIAADNIIIAVGYRAKSTLFEELRYESPYVYRLGDSAKVRNIRAAIWDGFEVARTI